MGIGEWAGYLTAAKTTIDIFKGIKSELPSGPAAEKAGQQIEAAERALKGSEAELAKALGYELCRCTWPPQIMLWREKEKVHRCPNAECGRTIGQGVRVAFNLGDAPPGGWMGR